MMESEKILQSGILEQYVLGLVSEEESAKVEEYMIAYPEIHEKVQRLRSCMEHYTGLHDISSPKDLDICNEVSLSSCNHLSGKARERCLSVETKFGKPQKQKQQKEQLAEMHSHTRLLTALASISILFFAGLSIHFYQKQANGASALAKIKEQFCDLKDKHTVVISQMQTTTIDNALLKDQVTQKMNMKGVGVMPEAEVVVYYNPKQKRTILDPVSLPKAPKNHYYQLWAEVDQRSVDMGTIDQQAEEKGLIPVDYVANADNFTITLKSNSDQPSEKGKTCLIVYR